MQINSDKQLFNLFKNGDEIAFTRIFNTYWEELFISAYHILKDEDSCKDIVQEIFITLWDRREEIEIQNLKAYLLQAVKYRVFKKIRENEKFGYFNDLYSNYENIQTVEYQYEFTELSGSLNKAIKNLPEKCSEVFHLSRIEGLSNPDIAKKLGISVSTVENQIYKALKILKKQFI